MRKRNTQTEKKLHTIKTHTKNKQKPAEIHTVANSETLKTFRFFVTSVNTETTEKRTLKCSVNELCEAQQLEHTQHSPRSAGFYAPQTSIARKHHTKLCRSALRVQRCRFSGDLNSGNTVNTPHKHRPYNWRQASALICLTSFRGTIKPILF